VERGGGHRHPADLHRLQHGHWRHRTGSPGRDVDADEAGHRHVGRELAGNRPARLARHRAEFRLDVQPIHLDDSPVDGEADLPAQLLFDPLSPRVHLSERLATAAVRGGREAPRLESRQHLFLGCHARQGGPGFGRAAIGEEPERSAGRLGGVLLAHRPRRGVPGVRKGLESGSDPLLVHALKSCELQIDLTAHLDACRMARAGQHGGNVGDRSQVRRAIFPHIPVAARGAHDEPPMVVRQAHGIAVDLELTDIATWYWPAEQSLALEGPRRELVVRVGIAEGEHALQVAMLPGLGYRCRADGLRRGAHRHERGVRRLDGA
jgi:hypothetical protein